MLYLSYLEKVWKNEKIVGSFKRKRSKSRRVQSPVLAVFLVRLQDLPAVGVSVVPALRCSPARGHCVCMMCVLAQAEHFHQTSVVVESRMNRNTGGGERKHYSGQTNGDTEHNVLLYHTGKADFTGGG